MHFFSMQHKFIIATVSIMCAPEVLQSTVQYSGDSGALWSTLGADCISGALQRGGLCSLPPIAPIAQEHPGATGSLLLVFVTNVCSIGWVGSSGCLST